MIIIGPGKFYTSIIPNFLVDGIPEAVRESSAKKVLICNLMIQAGNTDNLKVEDFLRITEKYLGKETIDYVIFNTGRLSPVLMKKVRKVFPKADAVDYDKDLLKNKKFIGSDLLDHSIHKLNRNDIFVKGENRRTMVLHNSNKLAKTLLKLCKQ